MRYVNTSNRNHLFYSTDGTKMVIKPGQGVDGNRYPDAKTHPSFKKEELRSAPVKEVKEVVDLDACKEELNVCKSKLVTLEENFLLLSEKVSAMNKELSAGISELRDKIEKKESKKTTRE